MSGRVVHLVVPDGVDDPTRPSGGNRYDRRVADALGGLGWQVVEHPLPGRWPTPASADLAGLAALLATVPDGALVLLDGLVASAAPEVLVPVAPRLALVVLVHLPLGGPGEPDAGRREAAVLHAARAVVTTSAWTRERLCEAYRLDRDRVLVARPGADPAPPTVPSASGNRLLCVAALTRPKGADVLLDALGRLAGLPWTCTWVGRLDLDPALVTTVSTRARAGGIGARLRLTGPLDRTALASAYAAADLLVLPSRLETYGMVVTEALAAGVPVVATDVGGVPEAFGRDDAGMLVPPGDPDALADALDEWLRSSTLRERWRRAAGRRRGALPGWASTARSVAVALQVAAEPPLASIRRPG